MTLLTIVRILGSIGLGILFIELGGIIGKACMLRAVKLVNSKTADDILDIIDKCVNSGKYHGLKLLRLKIVKYLYELSTKS